MRKNLYIIGARGFGRELACILPLWPGFADRYVIKGFLDDKADALSGFDGYPPVVSSVEAFCPNATDVLVCGLGKVEWRRKYIDIVLERGGRFETFVSPQAEVLSTAKLGQGVVVLGHTCVSADVAIGDFSLVHPNATFGHDTKIGKHVVVENGVFCGGFVQVGDFSTLHTKALVLPHQKIGENATVGAGSVVIRNVKPGATVFGNPAMRIDQ